MYPEGNYLGNNPITRAEFVTIMVRFLEDKPLAENPFTDVTGHWALDYILAAVQAGWIDGYPDGTFKPNAAITRAEAMKIINSVLNRGVNETGKLGDFKSFPDNEDTSAWYYYEVLEAINDHEYKGKRPNETWTRNAVDYVYDIEKYERH